MTIRPLLAEPSVVHIICRIVKVSVILSRVEWLGQQRKVKVTERTQLAIGSTLTQPIGIVKEGEDIQTFHRGEDIGRTEGGQVTLDLEIKVITEAEVEGVKVSSMKVRGVKVSSMMHKVNTEYKILWVIFAGQKSS